MCFYCTGPVPDQVLLARGAASGWVDWGGCRYNFTNAPVYAEKNWGAGFPKKWFWVQATGFEGEPDAALTCVGRLQPAPTPHPLAGQHQQNSKA